MKRNAAFAFVLLTTSLFAGHEASIVQPGPSFERLKSLAGEWTGTATGSDGKPIQTVVTYELISNGKAVMERINKGTPHEMVSIYHPAGKDGKSLAMVHYCSIGNQPKMALKSESKETLSFEMKGSDGLYSKKESHIHAVDLKQTDANHLEQTWTSYDKGKKDGTMVFALTRKKPA